MGADETDVIGNPFNLRYRTQYFVLKESFYPGRELDGPGGYVRVNDTKTDTNVIRAGSVVVATIA